MCLSNAEWDRGSGVAEFSALVSKNAENRTASLALARKRLEAARRGWHGAASIAGLLLSPLLFLAVKLPVVSVRVLSLVGWLAIVVGLARIGWVDYSYHRRLVERIESTAS